MFEELSCDATSPRRSKEVKKNAEVSNSESSPIKKAGKLDIEAFLSSIEPDLERISANDWSSYKKPKNTYEHLSNILGEHF